jgi:hypothetical protein
VSWAFFRDRVTDIHCNSDMLVVNGMSSTVATWRCPQGPQMVLSRYSSTPIIPWPGYVEGSSSQLAPVMQAIKAGAREIRPKEIGQQGK